MLIYNAKIYTSDSRGTVCENGFIEFGSTVTKVGDMKDCPDIPKDAVNANGDAVYPGFIDAHSHVGVWGNAEGVEGDDGNETTDPCTPHLRAIDMVNPLDGCFREAAAAGVTSVSVGPGSSNPIAGTFTVIKTAGSPVIDRRVVESTARNTDRGFAPVKFSFGENPKSCYRDRDESPVTRMATAAVIREQLYKARRYLQDAEKSEKDPDTDPPEYDIKCEALLPLLRGKAKMHAHCHRADDILTAVRIAKEFSLDLVLIHATDSAVIADELKESGASVILGPILCDRSKPELGALSLETAGILDKSGVEFAICTDHPVVPVQYLALSAGLAVRGGLDEYTALKSITSTAAKICGVYGRVGSLEKGKDADLLILDKEQKFYDVLTVPKAVYINGIKI